MMNFCSLYSNVQIGFSRIREKKPDVSITFTPSIDLNADKRGRRPTDLEIPRDQTLPGFGSLAVTFITASSKKHGVLSNRTRSCGGLCLHRQALAERPASPHSNRDSCLLRL
jgi:hypothetical protein